jgi:hypothetical protein
MNARAILLGATAMLATPMAAPAQDNTISAIQVCVRQLDEYARMGRAGGYDGWELAVKSGTLCPATREGFFSRADPTKPSDWYFGNTECLAANAMTPAWMVRFDQARGIVDSVQRLASAPDGTPTVVDVVMPQPNGMVSVIHYYRGLEACHSAIDRRKADLKGLD